MLELFPTRRQDIGTGDQTTWSTLRLMRQAIREGATHWEVRYAAVELVRHLIARDQLSEVQTIYGWLQANLRFTRDPAHVELIHGPEVLLRLIRQDGVTAADCDDYAILGGSLLLALGYPVRLKAVSTNQRREFNHVYLQVLVYGRWLGFDPIRLDRSLGWETGGIMRATVLAVS